MKKLLLVLNSIGFFSTVSIIIFDFKVNDNIFKQVENTSKDTIITLTDENIHKEPITVLSQIKNENQQQDIEIKDELSKEQEDKQENIDNQSITITAHQKAITDVITEKDLGFIDSVIYDFRVNDIIKLSLIHISEPTRRS